MVIGRFPETTVMSCGYAMDIHCQDMDILVVCQISPANVPHTIVRPHFLFPVDIPSVSVRDTMETCCIHFTDLYQGLWHSVCYNVYYVRSTRYMTDATGRAPTHQEQIHHVRTLLRACELQCSILLILLGLLPRTSDSLNLLTSENLQSATYTRAADMIAPDYNSNIQ